MAKQCKVKTNDSSIEQWQVRHNGHKFKVADLEDRIILSFDEANQQFYAYIKNPSSHTRYLYQNGKLGLTLCKLNTGVSQRKHMGVRDTVTATPALRSLRHKPPLTATPLQPTLRQPEPLLNLKPKLKEVKRPLF